ncbi:MAG: EAL domain-containing protein, partial [Pseudomonadota bacterium]
MLDTLLAEVFPFHIRVDDELRVVSIGPSAEKVFDGDVRGAALSDLITVVNPRIALCPTALKEKRRVTFLSDIGRDGFRLRGQMLPLDDGGFAYLCSPWIDDPAVMISSGLTESDFAPHESSVDHLYLMFTRAQQLGELNAMNARLKDSLRESERRASAEAALTRDLEVAADLRIEVFDGVLGAVRVNATSLASISEELTPGTPLADCPGWLVSAVREAQSQADASVHAVRTTVECGFEQRLLDLRVSRLSEREAILLGRDISEDQAEHLLLLQTLEQAMEAVLMVDDEGIITFFNQAAREMFGYARRDAVGHHVSLLSEVSDDPIVVSPWLDPSQGTHYRGESTFLRYDGSTLLCSYSVSRVSIGHESVVTAFLQDITQQRRTEERISFQAHHDGLTGLMNRRGFHRSLDDVFAKKREARTAVALVDMDNFKTVNDLLGHGAGDTFLKISAQRISDSIRDSDIACRLGGDEFAIILYNVDSEAAADRVMQRVVDALQEPMTVEDVLWTPTASVGVANGHGCHQASDVLRNADLAMYEAKALGKGRVFYFTEALSKRALARIETQRKLKSALANGEIVAHFQPVIDLRTGRIKAFEALARWTPPDGPPIPPGAFIPVAETSDLILAVENAVLDHALGAIASLRAQGESNGVLSVNVNISPRHFANEDLIPTVVSLLAKHRLPAEALTLELTESTLLNESADVSQKFERLRALGVRVALDDFGTGFSSLSYLDRYRFDLL